MEASSFFLVLAWQSPKEEVSMAKGLDQSMKIGGEMTTLLGKNC